MGGHLGFVGSAVLLVAVAPTAAVVAPAAAGVAPAAAAGAQTGATGTPTGAHIAQTGGAAEILRLEGRGVQVYRCAPAPDQADAAPRWLLLRPEAELLDNTGQVVGRHEAGPLWRYRDGSAVYGELVSRQPAPRPDAIPWLVLRAVRWEGTGLLHDVSEIRREQTSGGAAPAEGCTAATKGAERRVPYTALYRFLRAPAAPAGSR
ncbi:MAG: DUF3455 domain-containing protein [Gluconacetobacter diazotrophicus]|nr:DUF3455 domain-containing protein [Gluconacetobacter diazotrophicus]